MCGVEDHGSHRLAHDRKASHVGHEVAVTERGAALADREDVGVKACSRGGLTGLLDDVEHVARCKELALLDVDGLARNCAGADEIRLTAEEGGRLEHVDDGGDDGDLCFGMHVGENGHADLLANGGENAKALVHAGTAEGMGGRAVRLVIARLEEIRNAELVRGLLHGGGDVDGHLLALEHAGAGDQKERAVEPDVKAAELHVCCPLAGGRAPEKSSRQDGARNEKGSPTNCSAR